MAEQYPELKASQIILQYSSPWPKQDYKHIKDVKKNYSDKYSGITRAISIIVIFFLTNLLATPLAIQDMILQICTTAAIGYAMLIHIQLFYIYPALVIIPTLAILAIVFLMKHYYQTKRNEDDKEEKRVEKNNSDLMMKRPVAFKMEQVTPPVSVPHVTTGIAAAPTTRRQSLQLGVALAARLKVNIHESEDNDEEEEKEEDDEEEDLENDLRKFQDDDEQSCCFSDDDSVSHERLTGESEENSESVNFRFFDEEGQEEGSEEQEEEGDASSYVPNKNIPSDNIGSNPSDDGHREGENKRSSIGSDTGNSRRDMSAITGQMFSDGIMMSSSLKTAGSISDDDDDSSLSRSEHLKKANEMILPRNGQAEGDG
jgi:hypothetical protein